MRKKVVSVVLAALMSVGMVTTASAEVVTVGGTYTTTYPGNWDTNDVASHQITVLADTDWASYHAAELASEVRTGYEIKKVYFCSSDASLPPREFEVGVPESDEWVPTQYYLDNGIEFGGFTKAHTFSMTWNDQVYDDCAFFIDYNNGPILDTSFSCVALRLPAGYNGGAYYKVFDCDAAYNRTGHTLDYYFCGVATVSYEWKQDAKGWWVERPDGSYLVNEWYNDSGKWYYMGADGYMLTNTTTPDGYTVNADGLWVQ